MTYRGIAKGKTIELEESLPYRNGQRVRVSVEPLTKQQMTGSPVAILQAMDAPPHLAPEAVDEMLQAIEDGKLPVQSKGVFDE